MSETRKKIVVLGMMSKHPVPGVVWQTMHYLVGFERLGFEVYYVEAGAHQPSAMLLDPAVVDGFRIGEATAFIDGVMRRFGLAGRWAFHALHADRECYGLSPGQLRDLYDRAEVIINLHGGTTPLPQHSATGRLIYLETDPVQIQIRLHEHQPAAVELLEPHATFFTFAENYATQTCRLPIADAFTFRPTRQPIVCAFWDPGGHPAGNRFTTIGNWEQRGRNIRFNGKVYRWSKHFEFLKFITLPSRTGQEFELALSRTSLGDADATLLTTHGWHLRDALHFGVDVDAYREYIQASRAEFTVAKDQNVRLRTGWFSDRSATYLASGRPVVTQETGFSQILPTGDGLFGFSTLDEISEAVERINADYDHHSRRALAIARDYFDSDVVLRKLLQDIGVALTVRRGPTVAASDSTASLPALADTIRRQPPRPVDN